MLTGFPGRVLTNTPTGLTNSAQSVILPNTEDGQYFFGLIGKNGQPHFPYGYTVEPNELV